MSLPLLTITFLENFGQVFDQVVGQGFDQVLGEGKSHKYSVTGTEKYSVQCYSDGKTYYTLFVS